jgi:SAM-dependent methyltransferase
VGSTLQQTPAHDRPNPDLLAIMPVGKHVVEVGCSHGALARAYKEISPDSHYIGVEIDSTYAEKARAYCNDVLVGDIEMLTRADDSQVLINQNCWVFGDTLEHLRDPWQVLRFARNTLKDDGCICACIPNMQHWSIQLKLNTGQIRYTESGLLDRTHLRWFTRLTILALFENCGFRVELLKPRIFAHPQMEQACQLIGAFAKQIGNDPNQAIRDAMPLQYVIRALPGPTLPATS